MSNKEMNGDIKIRQFISSGEMDKSHKVTSTLLREAGIMIDHSCGDLFGPVIFVGTDGKTYTLTLEACIDEANPEYVRDLLDCIRTGS